MEDVAGSREVAIELEMEVAAEQVDHARADSRGETRRVRSKPSERRPLDALSGACRVVRRLSKRYASEDLARCAELVEQCFSSQDYSEGRRAFMEKRKPAFTGS